MKIKNIFKNNQEWIASQLEIDKNFFKKMAKGQQPDFFYIGCSDSRVDPLEMMGLDPGDVFVHRNIANMAISTDFSFNCALEYALIHLKVKHIIVCGHYGCGGVQSAMGSTNLGILNPWLQNIKDVYRVHKLELDAIKNKKERFSRLVELNVHEQTLNLMKIPSIQKAISNKTVSLHSWVFDIKTGLLNDLKLSSKTHFKKLKSVYQID